MTAPIMLCHRHGGVINQLDTPVVVYIVAGKLRDDAEIEPGDVGEYVEMLLRQPVARIEYCSQCFDECFKVAQGEIDRITPPAPEPATAPETAPAPAPAVDADGA